MSTSTLVALIALMTIAVIGAKLKGNSDDEIVDKLMNMPLEQILKAKALIIVAIGFLILSVALYSVGR